MLPLLPGVNPLMHAGDKYQVLDEYGATLFTLVNCLMHARYECQVMGKLEGVAPITLGNILMHAGPRVTYSFLVCFLEESYLVLFHKLRMSVFKFRLLLGEKLIKGIENSCEI